jgi:hypothetical protein
MVYKRWVWADLGTSSMKAMETDEHNFRHYLISPSIKPLSEHDYRRELAEVYDGVNSLGHAIIKYSLGGSTYRFLLGESANSHGTLAVEQKKIGLAIPRLLAFLGYLTRDVLNREESETVEINLTVMLPFDEYGDRLQLKPLKAPSLSEPEDLNTVKVEEFYYNGVLLDNMVIRSLRVEVEGKGLQLAAYPKNAEPVLKVDNPLIVVLGQADISIIFFNGDQLDISRSKVFPGQGYHDYIIKVSQEFGLTDELFASQKLSESEVNPDALKELLTNSSDENELKILEEAIAHGKESYLMERFFGLRKLKISGKKAVVFGGGGHLTFCGELTKFFAEEWGLQATTITPLLRELAGVMGIKVTKANEMYLIQFADIYGVCRDSPQMTISRADKILKLKGKAEQKRAIEGRSPSKNTPQEWPPVKIR